MAKVAANSNDAIRVRNLHKSYKDLKVLRGINFEVKRGTILALLDPNVAGKTTTIRFEYALATRRWRSLHKWF